MEQQPKKSYQLHGGFKTLEQNIISQDIHQRLTLLEEKVFKKKKGLQATEAQRFLIAYHLGFIEPILQFAHLQKKQKDLMVSVMLGIGEDNAKKFLLELAVSERPLLHTISNYKFLANFFANLNLTDQQVAVENILHQIESEEEARNK